MMQSRMRGRMGGVEDRKEVNILRHAGARSADLEVARNLALQSTDCRRENISIGEMFSQFKRRRGYRRRGASHKPHRFPLKLRINGNKRKRRQNSQPNTGTKSHGCGSKTSRRHRRRQCRSEKMNENGSITYFLPTHRWHAKRFHFRDLPIRSSQYQKSDNSSIRKGKEDPQYDFVRLPWQSCQHSAKHALRNARKSCIMHDASYMHCLYLNGSRQSLGKIFSKHIKNFMMETDIPKSCRQASLSNERLRFYDDNGHFVAPVDLIEKKNIEMNNIDIGIWVHAGASKQVLKILRSTYRAYESDGVIEGYVSLSDSSGKFGRIDLFGPKVHRILENVVVLPPVPQSNQDGKFGSMSSQDCNMFHKILQLANTPSVATMLSGNVLSVSAYDPRSILVKPSKLSRTVNCRDETDFKAVHFFASKSNRDAADNMSSIADHEMNIARQWSIPSTTKRARTGTSTPSLHPHHNTIGMLLWYRQGGTNVLAKMKSVPSLGCGWSLVLPRKCIPLFWNALAVAGAMAVGQSEMRTLALERGYPFFPFDYPDTELGKSFYDLEVERYWMIQSRKNTTHRTNYVSLRTVPLPKAIGLIAEKNDFDGRGCMLIERGMQQKMSNPTEPMTSCYKLRNHSQGCWVPRRLQNCDPKCRTPPVERKRLCAVHIRISGRGQPKVGCGIYLPSNADIELFARQGRYAHNKHLQLEKRGTLRDCQPSRAFIGILTSAGHSETMSTGIGIGVVNLALFEEDIGSMFLVMIRNTTSRWYMFAVATII